MVVSFAHPGQGRDRRDHGFVRYHVVSADSMPNAEPTEKTADMTDIAETTERWAPEPIADGTYLIDLGFQRVPGVIGSFLLAGNDELALFESGPTTTVANLARGVTEAGYD